MSAVDPKTRVLLDMIAMLGAPPLSETTPQQFRAMRARSRDMLNAAWPEPKHYRTFDVAGGSGPIRARLYDDENGARPTLYISTAAASPSAIWTATTSFAAAWRRTAIFV